jgi:hypothetical protein
MAPPLTVKYPNGVSYEYYADIANGDDGVMKDYMAHSVTTFTPIVVYKKDGTPFKDIKIFPSEGKIVLKHHATNKKETIYFDALRKGGFSAVAEFMGTDFNVDVKEVHDQLMKFIAHHEKVMKVFSSHLHRTK